MQSRYDRSWEEELAWEQSEEGRIRSSILNMKVPMAITQPEDLGLRVGGEYRLGVGDLR